MKGRKLGQLCHPIEVYWRGSNSIKFKNMSSVEKTGYSFWLFWPKFSEIDFISIDSESQKLLIFFDLFSLFRSHLYE